jgi:hypothetical protein
MPTKKSSRPKAPSKRKAPGDRATKDLAKAIKMFLKDGNMDRVQAWVDRLGEGDPARAVELWSEMKKYSGKPQ